MENAISGLDAASDSSHLNKSPLSTSIAGDSAEVSVGCRQSFKLPHEEQEYARPVDSNTVDVQPKQEELDDISAAASRLWDLDLNRLTPGLDYEIDCQNGKKFHQKEDVAENRLFSKLNKDVLLTRPTYARFHALLDNYTADRSVTEHVTEKKRQEELAFIEEISRTAPIMYLREYLVAKGIVPKSLEVFKKQLHSLWFKLYDRGGRRASSSAFERVFVGEIVKSGPDDERKVSGFHNWIQFYVEEAAGRLDYQGYILPWRRKPAKPDRNTRCLPIQFIWNGALKLVSGTFLGVSPEFELALYTLCFYGGQEDNYLELDSNTVNIKCYHLSEDKDTMASCYPVMQ